VGKETASPSSSREGKERSFARSDEVRERDRKKWLNTGYRCGRVKLPTFFFRTFAKGEEEREGRRKIVEIRRDKNSVCRKTEKGKEETDTSIPWKKKREGGSSSSRPGEETTEMKCRRLERGKRGKRRGASTLTRKGIASCEYHMLKGRFPGRAYRVRRRGNGNRITWKRGNRLHQLRVNALWDREGEEKILYNARKGRGKACPVPLDQRNMKLVCTEEGEKDESAPRGK